ncbi:MAG: Stringent starvation protein B [Paracidovorax wautersii]|uniref:Stringent starvation protein B n=1 Tax=Paracidovorax wautersii TaxID=1177982 RepID=A0A7V8JQJ3_9BURK|nr:MAG: Stringent starvation protein B [Paracidovorax wautersii]
MSDIANTSTRPYLIRALHEWCTDNGLTPYIAAHVDGSVQVPLEYVKDSEIVLNVSYDATSSLKLGNDFIEFKARFGGAAREIMVPIDHVVAIYARENGQGMAFPPPTAPDPAGLTSVDAPAAAPQPPAAPAVQLVVASSDEGAGAKDRKTPPASDRDDEPPPSPPAGSRPALKRVK